MKNFDYSTYLSPFTWRYGSDEMRKIWSEVYKRKLWRKIWVELARAQYKEGLVSKKELDDLIKHQDGVDIEKAHEIEKEIRHDLMAEIKTFANQAKIGGGKIHLGATSYDIEDNTDTIRYKESLIMIEQKLRNLLVEFSKKINQYKNLPCMAYTHLQPAEPTTLGYRFCLYAQDLLLDFKFLQFVKTQLLGKGFKGAVGTSASYVLLMDNKKAEKMEKAIMQKLGIEAVDISSQVAPRKIEYFLTSLLCSVSQSLYKFAFDVRIMQSPGFFEWQEPFGKKQVGSSAMPFKRNPIKSEQICSLARLVFHLSSVATDNAANMLLERTLDDSANRRIIFPEMFLTTDQILTNAIDIASQLVINEKQIKKNLDTYGPFASTEAVLVTAVKNGANRQEMHEILRELSMKAWEQNINLENLINKDKRITKFINAGTLKKLFDPKKHIGLATEKCTAFVKKLSHEFSN